MVWSFIILVIALILRIGVEQLSKTYDFLLSRIIWFDWLLVGAVILVVIFIVINIVKEIKKK